jgi:hypothetical protein
MVDLFSNRDNLKNKSKKTDSNEKFFPRMRFFVMARPHAPEKLLVCGKGLIKAGKHFLYPHLSFKNINNFS